MNSAIKFENVSFSYSDLPVLNDVSFDIKFGEFVAIVGENGAGKSTTMKLMLRQLVPNSGLISLFGSDINQTTSFSDVAYLSQSATEHYKNFPSTIRELVVNHLSYLRKDIDVNQLAEVVDLAQRMDFKLCELSGGQLQRVGLLLALIRDCKLILLDEPIAGVDKKFSSEYIQMLKKLSDKGCAVVMITHDLACCRKEYDRILRVEGGHIVEEDTSCLLMIS